MKLRTFLTSAVAAAAALAFTAPAAIAQTAYKSEYRMSLVLGTAFPWGKGGELWANKVRERTNGRINIKLYPGVSLIQGDQTREFSALRQGVIDMAVGSTINWSPQVKQLNLFSLPFLMPDYKALDALTQGEVGKELFAVLEKRADALRGEAKVEAISLSLDGATAATHDDIRQVPGCFERTLRNGRKAREVGLPFQVNTLVSQETVDDMPAIVDRFGARLQALARAQGAPPICPAWSRPRRSCR